MTILLVTTDLMCSSRIAPAAEAVGAVVKLAMTAEAVRDSIAHEPPNLVVLDLESRVGDLAAFVAACKQSVPPLAVIAFGPHVHEARLESARAAGCDAVYTRGQFHAQLSEILQKYVVERSAG